MKTLFSGSTETWRAQFDTANWRGDADYPQHGPGVHHPATYRQLDQDLQRFWAGPCGGKSGVDKLLTAFRELIEHRVVECGKTMGDLSAF